MSMHLTATELARNLADYLNRVAHRGERFTVVRRRKPVAELVPLPPVRHLGDLPELLASIPRLDVADAERFARDLEASRNELSHVQMEDPGAS
jgi:prevent-host-death family protein